MKYWYKRQIKIDEKFHKEISGLDLEIRSLTPDEKIEKVEAEVREAASPNVIFTGTAISLF